MARCTLRCLTSDFRFLSRSGYLLQWGSLITCVQPAPRWASPHRATSGTSPVAAFQSTPRRGFGANTGITTAQAPLQRSRFLPFQTVHRVAIGLPLTQRVGVQALPKILIVALGARQIHLALALCIQGRPRLPVAARRTVNVDLQRHAFEGLGLQQTQA